MALDSSRRAVFDTNELLENILSYLPLQELFNLQRVSQQWRGVIAASPGLQEKMFLRLQSATPEDTWTVDLYNPRASHKILSRTEREDAAAGSPKFRRVDGDQTEKQGHYIPTTLNPLMRISSCGRTRRHGFLIARSLFDHPTPYRNHLNPVLATMTAIERVFASWTDVVTVRIHPTAFRRNSSFLDMYLSNPPCRVAEGNIMVKFKGSRTLSTATPEPQRGFRIESDTGITLGNVVTAAL